MPCTDGREQQDRINSERRRNALAAILCGTMRGDERAKSFAEAWCADHFAIDELRKIVKYDFQSPGIGVLKEQCDATLDAAYAALCE